MLSRLEAPTDDVLAGLPVEVFRHEEPWVATVRSVAEDGTVVEVTWDQVAASVSVRVWRGDTELVQVEREAVVSVRAFETVAGVHFEADLSIDGLGGTLGVDVGATVMYRDVLLRR